MTNLSKILRRLSVKLENYEKRSFDKGMNNTKEYRINETGSAVRDKFEMFKSDIAEVFRNDTNSLLTMSQLSLSELVNMGYMHRKIDSFIHISEFSENDIRRFFYEECSDIDGQTLGPMELGPPDESVRVFVSRLKLHAVRCKLWFELVDFFTRLKNETFETN